MQISYVWQWTVYMCCDLTPVLLVRKEYFPSFLLIFNFRKDGQRNKRLLGSNWLAVSCLSVHIQQCLTYCLYIFEISLEYLSLIKIRQEWQLLYTKVYLYLWLGLAESFITSKFQTQFVEKFRFVFGSVSYYNTTLHLQFNVGKYTDKHC